MHTECFANDGQYFETTLCCTSATIYAHCPVEQIPSIRKILFTIHGTSCIHDVYPKLDSGYMITNGMKHRDLEHPHPPRPPFLFFSKNLYLLSKYRRWTKKGWGETRGRSQYKYTYRAKYNVLLNLESEVVMKNDDGTARISTNDEFVQPQFIGRRQRTYREEVIIAESEWLTAAALIHIN